ncbi:dephospho-CoA kinase [Rhodocyclaceae bacterium SMB388]
MPLNAARPFIVGLTGGIGSGKSAAADCFSRRGIAVIDTDAIAHALTAPDGAAMPAIAAAFGNGVIRTDGALDRDVMRERAFSDPAARVRLENILHPMIRATSERLCSEAASPYLILAVPLLIESGSYRERCDRICVVDCSPETQIMRVQGRSGLGEERIRSIMAAQASRAQRLSAADDVIENEGSLADLDAQVAQLDRMYRGLAQRPV